MTVTWAEVNAKLDYFLGDTERIGADSLPRPRTFPIPLRVYAWNWAQKILCKHTPLQKQQELVLGSDERSALLPSDVYQVHRIYDSAAEKFMRHISWEPGEYRVVEEDLPEFWTWGNQLRLEKDASSTALTLYYWAYYPDVELVTEDEGSGEILVPEWAVLPLLHLVTAICLNPLEVEATNLNQYKMRYEAGQPVHNPRADGIKFHLDMWHMLMSFYPPALGAQ